MIKCLNLGSGISKQETTPEQEWMNIDNDTRTRPDILRNLMNGIPFNDCTFDMVLSSHFFEHFKGTDLIFLVNEVWRVLKPEGRLYILSPYYKDKTSWIDVTHEQHFNEYSFEFFWFPTTSSVLAGVTGWFEPVVIEVAEERELRIIMLKADREKHVVKYGRALPDFPKMLKGVKKFYEYS